MKLFENFQHITAAARSIYTTLWEAQSFTTGADAHSVSSVKLYLNRTDTPGLLTVSIRETVPSPAWTKGVPTGADLTSGTFNSLLIETNPLTKTWYEIPVTEIMLKPNTEYAIVARTAGGNAVNFLAWGTYDNGGVFSGIDPYVGGTASYSIDGGVTWTPLQEPSTWFVDCLFQIWGNDGKEGVSETTSQPSTSSTVVSSDGARVRTVSHTTILTPWTA